MSIVDAVDTSGWWPAVEFPHLVDPSRVTRVGVGHMPGTGWVVRADLIGGVSATLVGSWPTEQGARARAEQLEAARD